jgi:hypothetical protein
MGEKEKEKMNTNKRKLFFTTPIKILPLIQKINELIVDNFKEEKNNSKKKCKKTICFGIL